MLVCLEKNKQELFLFNCFCSSSYFFRFLISSSYLASFESFAELFSSYSFCSLLFLSCSSYILSLILKLCFVWLSLLLYFYLTLSNNTQLIIQQFFFFYLCFKSFHLHKFFFFTDSLFFRVDILGGKDSWVINFIYDFFLFCFNNILVVVIFVLIIHYRVLLTLLNLKVLIYFVLRISYSILWRLLWDLSEPLNIFRLIDVLGIHNLGILSISLPF